jgi:hypothetical protein
MSKVYCLRELKLRRYATHETEKRGYSLLFSSLFYSTLLCSVLLPPSLQSAEPKHTAPSKRTCHRCRCCGDEGDLILQYSKQQSVTVRAKLCGTESGNAGSRVCEGCSNGHTHPLSHAHIRTYNTYAYGHPVSSSTCSAVDSRYSQ